MIQFILIKLELKLKVFLRLINKLKRKILENSNYLKIEEYYDNSYNTVGKYYDRIDYNKYKKFYEKYKLESYNGYIVQDGEELGLEEKEKQNKIKYKDWRRMDYLFTLPLHIEVVDKLRLRLDRSKYKFIIISWEKSNDEWDEIRDELMYLLGTYGKEMNFVYNYQTFIGNRHKSKKINIKINIKSELLINIDIINIENLLYKLRNDENIIKMGLEYNLNVKNELDFFRRKDVEYSYEENGLLHTGHDFIVFKLKEELEDYYVLGNHIMNFRFRDILGIANDLNDVMREEYINNRTGLVSEKQKANTDNVYILETLNYYVLYDYNIENKYIENERLPIEPYIMMFALKKVATTTATSDQFFFNNQKLFNQIKNIVKDGVCSTEKQESLNILISNFRINNELLVRNYKYMCTSEMDQNMPMLMEMAKYQRYVYSDIKAYGIEGYFSDVVNIISKRNYQYKMEKFEIINNFKLFDRNGIYLNVETNVNPVVNIHGKDVRYILNNHVNINTVDGNIVRVHPCTHSKTIRYNIPMNDELSIIKVTNKELYLNNSTQYCSTHPFLRNREISSIPFEEMSTYEKNVHSSNGLVAVRNISHNILENEIRPEVIDYIKNAQIDYSSFSVVKGPELTTEQMINNSIEAHYVLEKAAEFYSAVSG
jgi:hypothetical protein